MALNMPGASSSSSQDVQIKENRFSTMSFHNILRSLVRSRRRSTNTIFKNMFDLEGKRNDTHLDSVLTRTNQYRECVEDPSKPAPEGSCQKDPDIFINGKYYQVRKGRLKEVTVDPKMTTWWFGSVLDPRSREIQNWNRLFLISCAISSAVDPLFLYLFSINKPLTCIFVDSSLATPVTVMRLLTDAIQLVHMYIQLRLAYVSKRSLVQGRGELVFDARKVCKHYFVGTFWIDLYVFMPMPPVMVYYLWPYMIDNGKMTPEMLTIVLATYLAQYIPKLYHITLLIKRLQDVTGYIFVSAWGGFAVNVTAFFICAHVAGSCWYLLTIQQVETCVYGRCLQSVNITCIPSYLICPIPISTSNTQPHDNQGRLLWGESGDLFDNCMNPAGEYDYGIYYYAVYLVGEQRWLSRIMYPIFWGIMTLSTFGNALTPSNDLVEIVFSILLITCGLLLFSMLIGNIQMFLHSVISKKEDMQLRVREMEWWMRRRQIPLPIRERVRRYERHRWGALHGIDEDEIISNMPDGLRRDIQRHLCISLVRQVPLFHAMEDLVLDNLCEHLKRCLYMKGEMVYTEGEPVTKMVFINRGHIESSYKLNNNQTSVCILGPGHFCGDELLSWSLRTPFIERLPPSTATSRSLDSCEVFTLDNQDLHYVVDHFREKFEDKNLRTLVRFYSPSWRMWAAVKIQLAWRRFKSRKEISQPQGAAAGQDTTKARVGGSMNLIASMLANPKPQSPAERNGNNMNLPKKQSETDSAIPALGEATTRTQRLITSLLISPKPPSESISNQLTAPKLAPIASKRNSISILTSLFGPSNPEPERRRSSSEVTAQKEANAKTSKVGSFKRISSMIVSPKPQPESISISSNSEVIAPTDADTKVQKEGNLKRSSSRIVPPKPPQHLE